MNLIYINLNRHKFEIPTKFPVIHVFCRNSIRSLEIDADSSDVLEKMIGLCLPLDEQKFQCIPEKYIFLKKVETGMSMAEVIIEVIQQKKLKAICIF